MAKQETFKIEWIIDLMKEQEPERLDLIEQLENLHPKEWIRRAYVRFINGFRANQPNSEWQFKENIILEHPTEGTIILDILEKDKIGGIEFLNSIPH